MLNSGRRHFMCFGQVIENKIFLNNIEIANRKWRKTDKTALSRLSKYRRLSTYQITTGFLLISMEFLMFSGGIKRDQWHEMG